jgi:DNA-binding transcriptional LysR family regulator
METSAESRPNIIPNAGVHDAIMHEHDSFIASGIHSLRLYRDTWVCLVRKGHPQVKERLSLKQFVSLKHIPMSYPTTEGPGMVDKLLGDHGLKRAVSTTVTNFITAPFYVANSDCLSAVPKRVAQFFANQLPVRILTLPLSQNPLVISLVWHAPSHSDPAHMWMRNLIAATAIDT